MADAVTSTATLTAHADTKPADTKPADTKLVVKPSTTDLFFDVCASNLVNAVLGGNRKSMCYGTANMAQDNEAMSTVTGKPLVCDFKLMFLGIERPENGVVNIIESLASLVLREHNEFADIYTMAKAVGMLKLHGVKEMKLRILDLQRKQQIQDALKEINTVTNGMFYRVNIDLVTIDFVEFVRVTAL